MSWIFVALAGYFLNALASVFDKFLLHERIPKPSVYAFYVSMFSVTVLAFLPFSGSLGGFGFYGWKLLLLSIISGILFEYGLIAFYKAIRENEVSRVSPLVLGVISPLALLAIAFFFLGERLGYFGIAGFSLLAMGGALISLEFPLRRKQFFKGFAHTILAGILMAASLGMLKYTFQTENFLSGFIWNRLGSFLGGASFLLFPVFREEILSSIFRSEKKAVQRMQSVTAVVFLINKALAGAAMLVINYAIFLGSVALVQSVGSAQFAFVLLMVTPLSLKYPKLFQEKLSFWCWMQKIGVVLLIALGLIFISMEGKAIM